jgi:mycofactocin glycosyltransferase
LASLTLRAGDTLLVVDNTPGEPPGEDVGDAVPVVHAAQRTSPGYARNRGAERGTGEWIVFIDADTEPSSDLLDRYFDPAPAADTVLLAGGVIDEEVPPDAPGPARYAYLRRTLSQTRTLSLGSWSFGQAANLACRRDAFEAVGGFCENIRAAEDADLNFRLAARGGALERREAASVVHRNRSALSAFIAQASLHGAGSAWLSRRYRGAFPRRRRLGLIWWGIRFATRGCLRAARNRDRDQLVMALFEPLWELAFEFGRSRSVELPPGGAR